MENIVSVNAGALLYLLLFVVAVFRDRHRVNYKVHLPFLIVSFSYNLLPPFADLVENMETLWTVLFIAFLLAFHAVIPWFGLLFNNSELLQIVLAQNKRASKYWWIGTTLFIFIAWFCVKFYGVYRIYEFQLLARDLSH